MAGQRGIAESGIRRQRLKTSRAAAFASIVFALMYGISLLLTRTGIVPRRLVILTYGLALVLLVIVTYSTWITLVFPGWLLIISIFILMAHPVTTDGADRVGVGAQG